MSRLDFWLGVTAWYVLLCAVLLAGVSRFGADYIAQSVANPSVKIAAFLLLFVAPIPLIIRRLKKQ